MRTQRAYRRRTRCRRYRSHSRVSRMHRRPYAAMMGGTKDYQDCRLGRSRRRNSQRSTCSRTGPAIRADSRHTRMSRWSLAGLSSTDHVDPHGRRSQAVHAVTVDATARATIVVRSARHSYCVAQRRIDADYGVAVGDGIGRLMLSVDWHRVGERDVTSGIRNATRRDALARRRLIDTGRVACAPHTRALPEIRTRRTMQSRSPRCTDWNRRCPTRSGRRRLAMSASRIQRAPPQQASRRLGRGSFGVSCRLLGARRAARSVVTADECLRVDLTLRVVTPIQERHDIGARSLDQSHYVSGRRVLRRNP